MSGGGGPAKAVSAATEVTRPCAGAPPGPGATGVGDGLIAGSRPLMVLGPGSRVCAITAPMGS